MKTVRIFALWILVVSLSGCASGKKTDWTLGALQSHKWGYYSALPETRWDPDGRSMTLLNELRYIDPQGVVWIAPAGSKVDGASIPRSLWTFMGGPFEGKYRNASVLHDVAYEQRNRPWEDCDRMFYNAMRCSGVGAVESKTMYYALYKFGHHWKFPIRRAKRVKEKELELASTEEIRKAIPVNASELDSARDWIRSAEPSLEQIEQRADAEGN
jgi:endonuclease G